MIIRYSLITIVSILFLIFIWNDPIEISRFAIILTIIALLSSLLIHELNEWKDAEKRRRSLSVYKRNLLFKLEGTMQIIHWALMSYLSYNVSMMYPTTLKIRNMKVRDFQRSQFDSYKLYYDEIKYFTTSEIVPMEIKEQLDLLNLEAEKLINFLPIKECELNQTTYERYLTKILKIVRWSIEDDDSDDTLRFAGQLLHWVEMFLDLKKLEPMES